MFAKDWIEATAQNPLTGEPVRLLDWQINVIENMYGDNCKVKTPNLFIGFVKKTGKSALAAMLLAYRMQYKRRELYTVIASSEEQAFVIYRSFIELFKYSNFFADLKIMRNRIMHKFTESEIRILTSSASSTHGLRPTVLIADELMSFNDKNFSQLSILEESMSLSKDPQKIFLTNVPQSSDHKSFEVLKQIKKDESWQVVEFKMPKKYKWTNPKGWAEANPFIQAGYNQVLQNYKDQFKVAKVDKQVEVSFKRYKLGLGCSLDSHIWIDSQNLQWVEKDRDNILNDRDMEWSVGFDLSLQGADSTSWVLAGWKPLDDDESPLKEQKLYLYGCIYYGNISKKQSLIKENIINWHNQGYLFYQNTDVIKQAPILNEFNNFMNAYPHIKEDVRLIFDPALSHSWREALQDEYVTIARTYSPKEMTNPIRNMQRLAETKSIYILEKKNPAIEWQAACGFVSEMSRNWCMLHRLNKNPQLNVDYWSASLLALSELLRPRSRGEALVI